MPIIQYMSIKKRVFYIQWWPKLLEHQYFHQLKNGFKSVISIFCCSVSVGNNSLHFQTFILPLIVIISEIFVCTRSLTTASAPHRSDLIIIQSVWNDMKKFFILFYNNTMWIYIYTYCMNTKSTKYILRINKKYKILYYITMFIKAILKIYIILHYCLSINKQCKVATCRSTCTSPV